MRGILAAGAYLPYRRLDRSTIAPVAGKGGGTGTRAVASYDEDATTLAVAAGRAALRGAPAAAPEQLWFTTTDPPYLDKTNATAVHAALRLDASAPAFDAVGSVRSTVGALRAALAGDATVLITSGDRRTGLPGSDDEAAGGDAGAAVLVGSDADGPLLAEVLGWGSATEEFLDRWRTPGDTRSKQWEERFGEVRYADIADRAWTDALKATGLDDADVDRVVVSGTHERAVAALARRHGARAADTLAARVGNPGAAQPLLLLTAELERAEPGATVALVVLADGADVLLVRTRAKAPSTVAAQLDAGAPIAYGRFLAWRGMLPVAPPNRPEPARTSASAAARNVDWKFGFVQPGDEPRPLADAVGTVTTFTIDRLAYSPSPPVVFAVVDWDGGGRLPVELTDVDADEVAIGMRVEPTFRRLSTADGIHNYFWKVRPIR